MIRIASIVEGDGEVQALPVLLRRLNSWRTPHAQVNILQPIRVYKDRFLNRDEEFSRHVHLASLKCGDAGWILVLIDADDDCPADKGAQILQRAQALVPHRQVAVVLANREYEAWFVASAQSLDGKRGFIFQTQDADVDAEAPRDAKAWLNKRISQGIYRETTDQAAFSASMDLDRAHTRSRSFRKLCSEWSSKMAALGPVSET